MESGKLMGALERVLDLSSSAVLSTIGADETPQSRWMVAGMLRGAPGYLYAVTAPLYNKVEEITRNPKVAWLIQSPGFEEVFRISGDAVVVDNPSLKSTVLEALGRDLSTFWSANTGNTELVVIETAITTIDYVKQSTGEHSRESVKPLGSIEK
ncbi:MAG: pyridoxamine 5'-phosphate oxidase family protein [Spirochaetaceae bacterium]|nr:MAG: pyridoxamine 5'-phosphate oxidase family protein [Spirochaetaceae bacterium]